MSGLSIPLKTGSSATAVAYDTAIDGAYNIYNATLKNYPVANAFTIWVDTSQEKWWLQISSRTTQNNAWKTQLTFGASSWTGNISTKSRTYNFANTITQIDNATIAYGIYQRNSTLTFNETTNKIANVKGIASVSGVLSWGYQNKSYIASNGWNKFVIIGDSSGIKTYPVSATGDITSATPSDTKTISYTPIYSVYVSRYDVVAAKGQYVWVMRSLEDWNFSNSIMWRQFCQLYSISSSGVLTAVWAPQQVWSTFISGAIANTPACMWVGSYVVNNTAHTVSLFGTYTANVTYRNVYITVDLSTVSVFTLTVIKEVEWFGTSLLPSGYSWSINVWYDGSTAILIASSSRIFTANASAFTDTTTTSIGLYTDIHQYRQATSFFTADTNQVRTTSTNKFKIKNSDTNWSLTNLTTNCLFMYEMSWSNNEWQQASLLWVYLNSWAIWAWSFVLKANWSTINTIISDNYINPIPWTVTIISSIINANNILFELLFTNPEAIDTKIWFWLTWWTYASPTGNYETSTINLTLG